LKKVRIKGATKPWISIDLRKLMTERDYAKRVAKKSAIRNNGIIIAS